MFDDDKLERLLRDAHAVDAIESTEAPPASIRVQSPHQQPIAWYRRWGALAACAALLVGGIGVYRMAFKIKRPALLATVQTPDEIEMGRKKSSASVVMAVAEGQDGRFRCVKWTDAPGEWSKSGGLDAVTAAEFERLGLSMLCADDAKRVLVVGLQGPREKLPADDTRAREVAECILKTPTCGESSFNSTQCASAGCAGPQLNVRVHAIAVR